MFNTNQMVRENPNSQPHMTDLETELNTIKNRIEKLYRILFLHNVMDKTFEQSELQKLRVNIASFLCNLDKLLVKKGICDSCGKFVLIKTISFRDINNELYTINQCKKCFQSDWKYSWESYIEDFMILCQERMMSLDPQEVNRVECSFCPNKAIIYRNGLLVCEECLSDELQYSNFISFLCKDTKKEGGNLGK